MGNRQNCAKFQENLFRSNEIISIFCPPLFCKRPIISTSVGPLPGSWLAAHMADLTPDLQVSIMRVNSRKHPLSANPLCQLPPRHLGPPRPTLSINLSWLHHWCPYQRSLLFFRMRSRSSMPSRASSAVDLMVAVSLSFTLQICLITALSFYCRRWRLGFVNGQVSLAWSIVLRTQELYTWPHVLKERWREDRTGISSFNFFQAVFTCCGRKLTNIGCCLLGSKRKLPPPACQAQLGLPSKVYHLRGLQFPGTVYTCNQGPLPSAWAHCISCAPNAYSLCRRCCCCPTSVCQTAHGNSPELCRRSRLVPQIMTFVFPAFTVSPSSSIAFFQVKSLLTHSSSDSAMITRSSAEVLPGEPRADFLLLLLHCCLTSTVNI